MFVAERRHAPLKAPAHVPHVGSGWCARSGNVASARRWRRRAGGRRGTCRRPYSVVWQSAHAWLRSPTRRRTSAAPRQRRACLGLGVSTATGRPFEAILIEHGQAQLSPRSRRAAPARRLRHVHGEKVLDGHHAPVRRHVTRILRRHAAHRRRARRPRGSRRRPCPPGPAPSTSASASSARHHRRIVRRIEVVAEPDRPRPRERIALRVLLGAPAGPLQRLQIGHHVHDAPRAEDPAGAPRRHIVWGSTRADPRSCG